MEIAIVVVAYNRQDSVSRLLNSLLKSYYNNKEVSLIISIDKSNTSIIEDYADSFNWPFGPKIVDKHSHNLGLRQHMLSLRKWFDTYDSIIVLEDDVVVSLNFYSYAQQTVDKYYHSKEIAGISLYSIILNYQTQRLFYTQKNQYDVYFMNCAISWGEIWMRDQFNEFYNWYENNLEFDYNERIPEALFSWNKSSWLKYHIRYCIEKDKYFIHPYVSFSTNFCDVGEHNSSHNNTISQVVMQDGLIDKLKLPDSLEQAICYDGFFENKAIYKTLNLDETQICIDLNACKKVDTEKYWLTTRKANYKIVNSYGLSYQPIEKNIILNVSGNDIYLYDTSQKCHNKQDHNYDKLFSYSYHVNNLPVMLFNYGVFKALIEFLSHLFYFIKKRIM